ncbi:MAG: hypothetical protein ACR2N7_12945 [Acidimicrobiia bacterium]
MTILRRTVTVLISVAVALSACAGGDDDPGAVVESYIEAYNNGDFDAVMAHFVVESTITGHPTDFDPVATDIYSIRSLHKQDLGFRQKYVVSNLSAEGDTVTWNSVWGDDGCVQGHSAVVKDGKMLSWIWGEFVDCSDLD